MIVSAAQMHISLAEPDKNLAKALDWIAAAARQGSMAILFPELWTSGCDLPHSIAYGHINLEILQQLAEAARKFNISIGGSYLLPHGKAICNSFVWLSPNLPEPVVYSKIHLFRKMEEHNWLEAGDRLVDFTEPWAHSSLAVCYDLRFPEMFRTYALSGTQIQWLCAEWPTRRIDHFTILCQARAIENQFFFIAANAVGMTGGENYGGCSKIISPWGEVLAEGNGKDEVLLTTEIDLQEISRARKRITALSDRRPDIYGMN